MCSPLWVTQRIRADGKMGAHGGGLTLMVDPAGKPGWLTSMPGLPDGTSLFTGGDMTAEAPSAVSADDSPQSVVGAGDRGADPQGSDGAGAGADGAAAPGPTDRSPISCRTRSRRPASPTAVSPRPPAGAATGPWHRTGPGVPTGAVRPTGGGPLNGNAARRNGADPAPDDPPATHGYGDTAVATSTDVTGTEPTDVTTAERTGRT